MGIVIITVMGILALASLFPNQEMSIVHDVEINEKKGIVYKILSKIDNVDEWNPPVHEAIFISENKQGIGATRQCTLADGSIVKETVTNAVENNFIEMEMIKHNMPVNYFKWKIDIKEAGNGTLVQQTTRYKMKYGLLGILLNKILIENSMKKVFNESYQGLKKYIDEYPHELNDKELEMEEEILQ